MIPQTDATTLSALTTTNPPQTGHHKGNSHLNNSSNNNSKDKDNSFCHPSKSPISNCSTNTTTSTTSLHNGKNSKGFCNISKKRKRYEEFIIDGFAINAFKTWEDLQDEVNERTLSKNNNNNNNSNSSNNNNNDNSADNSIRETNSTADRKVNSKSKQKSSSTSATTTNSDNPNIIINASNAHNPSQLKDGGARKKDKAKKKADAVDLQLSNSCTKDKQRNKTSSEKTTTLKRALEAKELELELLQEKLKQEQCKNRGNSNKNHDTNSTTNSSDHYSRPMQTPQTANPIDELHSRSSSGMLGHDLLIEPNPMPPRAAPYSPYHVNSHLHKLSPYSTNQHPMQLLNTPPSPPRSNQSQSQPHHNHHHHIKHSSHLIQQHPQSPPIAPPLSSQQSAQHQHQQAQSNPQHQQPSPAPPQSTLLPPQLPHSIHQSHSQYLQRHPQLSAPQPPLPAQPNPHLLPPHHQPPMHPYSSQPPSSMMSSMGLGPLPSPYGCPPSIYITDTISRQTSIIPPPIAPALEQASPHAQASRFGHSSVLQSITPYNLTPHHPMYYPTLPTERSFIEFARSYTGPGHLGYPNLMSPYPSPSSTSSSSITANPYSFDRWPRVAALDHQRAVSRYNSLYQSTSALPDRSYPASYASNRPPSFPAGLFVSIAHQISSAESN